jgi:superfamily II DNA/RNA helicase
MKFDELGMAPAWVNALAAEGISEPTPIQRQAIAAITAGGDTYVSSETGTGKTLAYLLPLLGQLDAEGKALQVMVLVPTHELALQIRGQVSTLAQAAGSEIRSQVLVGGTSMRRQLEQLKAKPHLIAGTAQRVLELIKMRKLKVHTVRCVVIDEADRMLTNPVLGTVQAILHATPRSRQLVFVSATQQAQSRQQADALAPNLVMIDTGGDRVSETIEHLYVVIEERKKPDLVRRLIHAIKPERALVFVHRNARAEELAGKLAFHKMRAVWIHGAASKIERQNALRAFRSGQAQVLISSDLSARGMDLPGVTHVFNLDPPTQSQDYLHRAGRTGRAGAQGCSVLLLDPRETRLVTRYQRELGIELHPIHLERGTVEPGVGGAGEQGGRSHQSRSR